MEIWSNIQSTFAPLQTRWIPNSNKFVIVGSHKDGKGAIKVWQIDQFGKNVAIKSELETTTGLRCCTFGLEPVALRRLVTGQYCGKVSAWDLEHSSIPIWSVSHKQLVNSVDCPKYSGRPEVLSSSRDGLVNLWDTRVPNKPVISFESGNIDCWVARFGISFLFYFIFCEINSVCANQITTIRGRVFLLATKMEISKLLT